MDVATSDCLNTMHHNWILQTEEYVKKALSDDASGHDWWHVYRVHKLAKKIAEKEKADLVIVELAALLHDISDWKLNGGDLEASRKVISNWLNSLHVPHEIIDQVTDIVDAMSFKGALIKDTMETLEGKVVQDADRLDAMGAIGIARTFAYGGYKQRKMHDPCVQPVLHRSFEEYRSNNSPTINHFYEKLLLLKNRMKTQTGKKMAIERHKVMEQFLKQFFKEWEAEK